MALGDPFSAVLESRTREREQNQQAFNPMMNLLGALVQQEQAKEQKNTELLATLATKGLLPATNLPQEPQTIEDYQRLAQGAGQGLTADTPETAKRLLEASGIQIPKRPQTFKLGDLGEFYHQTGIGTGKNIADISDLPSNDQVKIRALARKLYGVRGAEYGLPAIAEEIRQGKTVDQVEDELRFAGQSPEFVGAMRNAAQSLTIGKSESIRNSDYDALDDYVQQKDTEGAKNYLKRMAIDSSTADQQNQIMGKERTVEFLNEIKDDLKALQDSGINTNIFTGTEQEIKNKIGLIGKPELVSLATKIALGLFEYRRSMTGVQFGMKEHAEYGRIFPNIKRVGEFNIKSVDTLQSKFADDLKTFYKLKMGSKNYKELFGEETESAKEQSKVGKIMVINPQGKQGYIPTSQLEKALSQGYRRGQ